MLPQFLIIGAMKSGTTSLYRDLCTNPRIFMPADKEPHALCVDSVLSRRGRAAYARLFRKAGPRQVCGEASTGYTKAPDFGGVPDRARRLLGGDLKLIYIVREPVSRIISHHHHRYSNGRIDTADIHEAIQQHEEFFNWSRYAMQARLWLEHFDRERLRILRFEDYIAERRGCISDLSGFLGVEPRPELVRVEEVHNPSEGKTMSAGLTRRIIESSAYRTVIRPLIPQAFKAWFQRTMLPAAPPKLPPPTADTVEWIAKELRHDLEELRELMGLERPVWDMDAVIAKYRAAEA